MTNGIFTRWAVPNKHSHHHPRGPRNLSISSPELRQDFTYMASLAATDVPNLSKKMCDSLSRTRWVVPNKHSCHHHVAPEISQPAVIRITPPTRLWTTPCRNTGASRVALLLRLRSSWEGARKRLWHQRKSAQGPLGPDARMFLTPKPFQGKARQSSCACRRPSGPRLFRGSLPLERTEHSSKRIENVGGDTHPSYECDSSCTVHSRVLP